MDRYLAFRCTGGSTLRRSLSTQYPELDRIALDSLVFGRRIGDPDVEVFLAVAEVMIVVVAAIVIVATRWPVYVPLPVSGNMASKQSAKRLIFVMKGIVAVQET